MVEWSPPILNWLFNTRMADNCRQTDILKTLITSLISMIENQLLIKKLHCNRVVWRDSLTANQAQWERIYPKSTLTPRQQTLTFLSELKLILWRVCFRYNNCKSTKIKIESTSKSSTSKLNDCLRSFSTEIWRWRWVYFEETGFTTRIKTYNTKCRKF